METTKEERAFEFAKEKIWEALDRSHRDIDKMIISFSSGALALSLLLMDKLFDDPIAIDYYYLRFSWGAFVAAIVITFFGLVSSTRYLHINLFHIIFNTEAPKFKYLKKFRELLYQQWTNLKFWESLTPWLNLFGRSAFVIGIVTTLIFATINLEKVQQYRMNNIDQKGSTMTDENSNAANSQEEIRKALTKVPPIPTPDTGTATSGESGGDSGSGNGSSGGDAGGGNDAGGSSGDSSE